MAVYRAGTNKSSTNVFPNIRPSLDLDFANTKTLDPRITYSRASGGSYVGADGLIKYAGVNEARFDHDPVTGESLGLLIEEARTNLINYNTKHDDANWANSASSETINTTETLSPDGKNNATKLFGNINATSRQSIYQGVSVTSGTTYTFSVFLKEGQRRYATLWFDSVNTSPQPFWGAGNIIDLQTGTIVYRNRGSTEVIIVPYPNGWYRCYVISSPTVTQSMSFNLAIGTANNFLDVTIPDTYKYTGDGSSGIYIWGHQVEVGSFPTSYIPTQGSTRTRAADNASITGKNFSSWYRQDEGTVFCEVTHGLTNYRAMFYSISRGLTNSYNIQYYKEPLTSLLYNSNTTNQDFIGWNSYGTTNYKNYVKTVRTYGENELIHSINGAIFTDVLASGFGTRTIGNYSAKSPTGLNRLTIGNHPTIGASHQNGTIKRFTYYSKVLPPSQIQALTR